MVAILDADKEGFLRSDRSLIQTIGRAARNAEGRVILYADKITGSMKRALDETARRREKQQRFNLEHHIKPKTIQREVADILQELCEKEGVEKLPDDKEKDLFASEKKLKDTIVKLERQMRKAAQDLEFEQAARLRDEIRRLEQTMMRF